MAEQAIILEGGSPAPNFRLPASNGGEVGLDAYRGKSNLVIFFVREFN